MGMVWIRDEVSGSPLPSLGLPEVAFIGRSNVGKSSMLNTLAGVRKAAAVSKTPGRTQQVVLRLRAEMMCRI